MRKRSISTATALAVLFSSAALSVVAAGPASAATVSVGAPGGIVVDGPLKRVFVSDEQAGTIWAADYTGAALDSVDGLAGAGNLAVSDDGATLYVAVPRSDEIVALDAATLDIRTRYALPDGAWPRHVAFTGGRLWFTYGDRWEADLGSVDPAADAENAVTMGLSPFGEQQMYGQALLDTDPARPGVLAVAEVSWTPDSMAVLDVTTGTPRVTAWRESAAAPSDGDIRDIDLVPGADEVLVNGTVRNAYADGAFSETGRYPDAHGADVAPNGLIAGADGTGITVYRPGTTTPLHTYPGYTGTLAWAPDSSRIFAVVRDGSGGEALKVLTDPTLSVPALTVDAPSSVTRGKQLTVTGKLTASVPLPAGSALTVTRTDAESPGGKALPTVTVAANGSYSFTDTPQAGGPVTYRVAYAGDAQHTAVSVSREVEASYTTTSLSLNKGGNVYAYGTDVSFTAHLGTTYKNRTVEIWANPYGGDKPNKLIKTGTVNSSGNFSATVDMTRDTEVMAVFAGDTRYAPKTVRTTAYARVKVSTAVTKHYKRATIGSHSYYWFHKKTAPVINTTMSYYKGRKQRLQLQVYSGGAWRTTNSEYFALDSAGKSSVNLGAPGTSGIKARVRSAYINDSSGDNVNSTTYGTWKYLYFSN
ncbi:Ig-like domain repeat protein [Streptomyces sp. NPDC052225]|uniref:Ig-like domain repeat protein n=1 Tax=Streptomyces sp. NPDC052225 TaxID=3154949 RepID=UPI003413F97F